MGDSVARVVAETAVRTSANQAIIQIINANTEPHPDPPPPLLSVERYVYPVLSNTRPYRGGLSNNRSLKNKKLDKLMSLDTRVSDGSMMDDGQLDFLRDRLRGRFL